MQTTLPILDLNEAFSEITKRWPEIASSVYLDITIHRKSFGQALWRRQRLSRGGQGELRKGFKRNGKNRHAYLDDSGWIAISEIWTERNESLDEILSSVELTDDESRLIGMIRDGYTHEETAETFGIGRTAVTMRLNKIVEKIKAN